jgi:hypothetical protein
MRIQIIMDRSGDTRHSFDPADPASLDAAQQRFLQLTGKGFSAVALGKDGRPGALVRNFDPTVEETLFIPQLQGG